MGLKAETRVGKRNTICIPKAMAERVGLRAGMKVLITVEGDRIVVEPLLDPVSLALRGEKYATTSIEEVEAISHGEQSRFMENPP
ncbi:MAG TPA: AbrB/MazE/SpoVT family DNA-binding domain-containing protein [Candidatus Thorarchaeota archaeon]|nr:AbrB/MazE/SpoVT family DNA-binding domain-containing protein [Candidatus Thorarchaeota archaeon]